MRKGDAVALLALDISNLPVPEREYRFAPPRRWRFDFAWPDLKVAVEVDGGTWSGGRHTSGSGYDKDAEKLNTAAIGGWLVLRFSSSMIRAGGVLEVIEQALAHPHEYCYAEFHRCDGGGPGEHAKFIDNKP